MKIEYIASLIELFESSTLTKLHIQEEGKEITLKREKKIQAVSTPIGTETPVFHPSAAKQTVPEDASTQKEPDTIIIPSPIVGTFYRTPAPDAPPFIEVGDTVKTGDALCIIEAMKMLNRLEAEFPCEIVSIRAKNGELVEYDEGIIEVRPL